VGDEILRKLELPVSARAVSTDVKRGSVTFDAF
jgi:hypothetical protein